MTGITKRRKERFDLTSYHNLNYLLFFLTSSMSNAIDANVLIRLVINCYKYFASAALTNRLKIGETMI